MSHAILNMSLIILIAFWAVTVRWRIMHNGVRNYFLTSAFLMIFWLAIRRIKWEYVSDPNVRRYLWYLYYLPMLMISLLSLCIALLLGKPENYRLTVRTKILSAVTVLLICLVLTNDLHQWVFSFPADAVVWTDEEYRYGAGYFVVVAWALICALSAFLVMIRKARALRNRKVLMFPILSMSLLLVYSVFYVTGLVPRVFYLYDMTFVFCICITATLEGCIQSGLIQVNTHYAKLFRLLTIDGQIADERFRVQLTSDRSEPLTEDAVRRAVEAGAWEGENLRQQAGVADTADGYIRLVSAPLKKGYVLWKEDITEISELIAELTDKSEYLAARKAALQEEVDTRLKERQLVEKNRLYHALMDEMKDAIDAYGSLLEQIRGTEDSAEIQRLTKRLAVICTYIKRRSNLIFLAEEDGLIRADELYHAMGEWILSLKLGDVACGFTFDMKASIPLSDMLFLYDAFQKLLLFALEDLKSLFVNCGEKKEKPYLLVNLTCSTDFSSFDVPGVDMIDEDGEEKVLEITIR